jgi:hypothetical protein
MGQPVYRFLEEFACDDGSQAPVVVNLRPRTIEQAPSDRIAERLHEAHARGREDGEAAVRERMQREIDATRVECERQIALIKSAYGADLTQALVHELKAGLDEIGGVISDDIASVLMPVLVGRLTEDSVKQLAREIKSLVETEQAISIEVSGPDELLERLLAHLAADFEARPEGSGPAIKRVPGTQTELRVVHDRSAIETRLGEWLDIVKKAVG